VAPPGLGTGGPPPPAVDELLRRYDTGRIDLATFAREIAPFSGMSAHDVIRLQECYLLGPYAGVGELLDELAAAGVRTACLSKTSDRHWRMMLDPAGPNHLPLARLDYRFASHLLGMRKPDEAIYAHVEREARVPGAGIVFFDDVAENVEAARRRGWHGYRIDPTPDDPLPQVRSHLRRLGVI
jgi:putative hydrolase of the HAD superfamily